MMIECESVLQQMCTVSYNHTRKILPFVRLDAAFFLDRKSPFYADFSGNAMWKVQLWTTMYSFFFSRSTLKNLGLFAYLCYEKRIRARNFWSVHIFCNGVCLLFCIWFCWLLNSFPIFNALRSGEERCFFFCLLMFSFLAWSICHSSLCCWLCFINVLHVQNFNQTNGLLSLAYNSCNGKFLLIFPRFRFVDLLLMLPCPSTMAHIYALCGEKNATLFIIFGWKGIRGLCRQLLRSKWGNLFHIKSKLRME